MRGKLEALLPGHRLITVDHTEDPELVLADVSRIADEAGRAGKSVLFEGAQGTMLDVDHNIACRAGLHCAPLVHEGLGTARIDGAVRFGIGPFNTEEHIEHAIAAVKAIAASRARA